MDSRYDSASKAEADAMELKSSWETRMKSAEDEAGAIIKEAVEKAPNVILEGAKKEDAEAAKKELEEAGAAVTLK